jgi:hypothetical protein
LESGNPLGFLWNQFWCRPNLTKLLANFHYRTNDYGKLTEELTASLCGVPQISLQELIAQMIAQRRRYIRRYDGIVVSGPLANAKVDQDRTVCELLLDSLSVQSDRILIDGDRNMEGLLARGAYRFAIRLSEGQTTYLDTLPRLEMVILEKGEPAWIDLLEPNQKWVEGGKEWQRPERVQNMRIPPKSCDLKIAIANEDFEEVREVVTGIPETSVETERVSLSVKMTPAQGNARIEIHPHNESLFKNKRVFIDWKHMRVFRDENGQPNNKEGYLNSLPRIFPQLLPRLSSASKIRIARISMDELKAMFINRSRIESVEIQLRQVRQHLQAKDPSMYPRDGTAFDSEGTCASNYDLRSFMEVAWPYFQRYNPEGFVRAIAYTHVDYAPFHDFIVQGLRDISSGDAVVLAAGKCLRKPEQIAVFISSFMRQLGRGGSTQTWWRALSEILRFRGNALQNISSEECLELLMRAGKVCRYERVQGNGGETFRLACLVIVYTLRRRAYDDLFLDPKSELAETLKSEFKQARLDAREQRLRLIKGSVNLSEQLQLIIDYVDRQGKGQLLIGE